MPSDTGRQSRTTSRAVKKHEQIFDGYNTRGGYAKAFDEMFNAQGNVRGPYKGIFAELYLKYFPVSFY